MGYLRSFLGLVVAGFLTSNLLAQNQFNSTSTRVIHDGEILTNAFAGGINSVQYNEIDLNEDRSPDLVLFDRSSNRLSTYLSQDGIYHYTQAFEASFPEDLVSWVLLRDYDCDGLNDLFTDSQQGMRVFKNLGGIPPQWELVSDPVRTLGSQVINLFFNASDIASIDDLDGDGDLDVLAYNFATGENIDYHQNMSMEKTGQCGLDFERITRNYGGLSECNCGEFVFNEPCPVNGRVLHSGGKAILSIDLDNDGDKELLSGEETCDELNLFTNNGDMNTAVFTDAVDLFGSLLNGERIHFPAAYYIDLDFDGTRDLVISTNLRENDLNLVDMSQSSLFYHNNGTESSPDFQLESSSFLQGQMIDVGERAYPSFYDYDKDGDQDLFIGSRGSSNATGLTAAIHFYENIGDFSNPGFQLRSRDFLNLTQLDLLDIQPQFEDLDVDGNVDLVLFATPQNGPAEMLYLPNQSSGSAEFDINDLSTISQFAPLSEHPYLTDIDLDGVLDLLIGRTIGSLEYYRNLGTNLIPDYVLENEAFLEIETSIERINVVPFVYDIAKDGEPDLILTDGSGEITIYQDFKQGGAEPLRAIVQNPLYPTPQTTQLGRISWPVMTDFYNSGEIDLVVGTIGGGLLMYTDNSGLSIDPDEDLEIEIFPNPSQGDPVVIRSKVRGKFQVISITGQQIIPPTSLDENEPFVLDSNLYQAGVYLVRFIAFNGEEVTKRMILNN